MLVAKEVAELAKSTRKFVAFLGNYAPPPPRRRPLHYRVDWSNDGLRKAVHDVYKLRSKALHVGKAVPWQLCGPPDRHRGVPVERPRDHRRESGDFGSHYADEDIPMQLHVFEHIVRGALIRWWKSRVPGARKPRRRAMPER
jgi:hypothetical protein